MFFGTLIVITQESYIQFMITGFLFYQIPGDLAEFL